MDGRFGRVLISNKYCPYVFINISLDNRQKTPNILIFSSCIVLVPLFQCTKKRMARKGFYWWFQVEIMCWKASKDQNWKAFIAKGIINLLFYPMFTFKIMLMGCPQFGSP